MKLLRFVLILGLLAMIGGVAANETQSENASKFSDNFLGLNTASNQVSIPHILEFWGYHNWYEQEEQSNTLKLRYYQPLQIDRWQGIMRLDTSYVSLYGPDLPQQSSGNYNAGNTMLTIWGNHPNLLNTWGGTLGGRIIFPFGNNGQWAAGPQMGTVFIPPEGSKTALADFSPLVRYMYGFYSKNSALAESLNQPALARRLELYPTIGFNLSPSTQLRFWDENGIVLNTAGGGWFVPIDVMVTQRLDKSFLVALGASKQVVQSYQQYNWSLYGKISLSF
jgi:hypothetical protein